MNETNTNFDLDTLTISVKALFNKELDETAFNTFIMPIRIKAVDSENHTALISVPTELVKQGWENGNYSTPFRSYMFNLTSELFEPTLVVDENNLNKPLSNQQNMSDQVTYTTSSALSPDFTFKTWVTGDTNRMATAASLAVADGPGTQYNPLLLYGNVGLGKTHLMVAVGNKILEKNPNANVKYVSAEDMLNDYVRGARFTDNPEYMEGFKREYRNVDVLLIDDIQLIQGKPGIQEEFFNTFNTLTKNGKQIVMTSDRLPKDIPNLEDRLVSRFMQGVTYPIERPDFTTRFGVLQNLTEKYNLNISNDVLEYIAHELTENVRDLEGAFNSIRLSFSMGTPVTLEAAKNILSNAGVKTSKVITTESIKKAVSKWYDVSIDDLDSKKRNKEIVLPRQVAMYLVRTMTDTSLPKIGQSFGGRDHTTVMHSTDKITELLDSQDPDMRRTVEQLITNIKESS